MDTLPSIYIFGICFDFEYPKNLLFQTSYFRTGPLLLLLLLVHLMLRQQKKFLLLLMMVKMVPLLVLLLLHQAATLGQATNDHRRNCR